MADWEKIKTEYITTTISYRDLAEKHGVNCSQLTQLGGKEKWTALRKKHKEKTVEKSVQKVGDRQATALAKEFEVIDKLTGIVEAALEDPEQLFRHVAVEGCGDGISEQTERVFLKLDTKALRDLTASINSITKTKRDILGGTIVVDKMDRERIRQTDEKLAIDKEKVTKEVDDREVGVVILPAVKVDSDE